MRYSVTVEDMDLSVDVRANEVLLSALLERGVRFAYNCQAGNCGTCKCVLVSGHTATLQYSEGLLSEVERSRGVVLACRTLVRSDLVIRRHSPTDPV